MEANDSDTAAWSHQQQELKEEHDDLAVASARLQSLDRVQNSEVAKGLVSVAPSATIQD